ncbi:VOC family protein [Novosphingobium aquimarinum]|uniref:VOC family protein n=1 Tax=Novosphingobium aquimarinum TaxID=2682494 RepID=UPI0012EB9B67|nr:VOC family protein [Novosphingobium aquimarinum]
MLSLSHRGICISDMARSERFYREALGFEPYQDHGTVTGPDMEKTMQLPGVQLRCIMLKHPDGPVIELLHFLAPESFGPRERRSMLDYGLVHLSFYVDDIDASAERIVAAGGKVYEETRAHYAEGGTTMLYCTDPDGVRIELMHADGVPARFSHSGICVDDIEASMRYYQALGFEPSDNHMLDTGMDWLGTIMEVPGIKLRAQMIQDGAGNVIELLKVFEPGSTGSRERRKLNQYGLTHLAFWDDQPDATVDALTSRGGHFVEDAHVKTPGIELFHGADPDGVRIELMKPMAA